MTQQTLTHAEMLQQAQMEAAQTNTPRVIIFFYDRDGHELGQIISEAAWQNVSYANLIDAYIVMPDKTFGTLYNVEFDAHL